MGQVTLTEIRKALVNVLEDLEEEKAKADALLAGIGDGVVAVDASFRVIYANSVAGVMLGWKGEEMIGLDFFGLVSEKKSFYLPVMNGKKISSSVANPKYYYRRDGSKFPVAVTLSPVMIGGKTVGAVAVFRDISREIEIDRMKTEFISLASHQLRTPLSAMKWYGEMLLGGDAGKLNTRQREFVDNIFKSNEKMIALVNSLLNISRIESGRIVIDPKPVDIKKMVVGIVDDLKMQFEKKRQVIKVISSRNLKRVTLDPKLISEVVKNLLTNANKYTPAGGRVEVKISQSKKDTLLVVSDNGYGIPKADQGAIFTKFKRAGNVQKLEVDGTGLGLYLVKAIVESSGGRVWFESEENKGSTFYVTIPILGVRAKKGEVSLSVL